MPVYGRTHIFGRWANFGLNLKFEFWYYIFLLLHYPPLSPNRPPPLIFSSWFQTFYTLCTVIPATVFSAISLKAPPLSFGFVVAGSHVDFSRARMPFLTPPTFWSNQMFLLWFVLTHLMDWPDLVQRALLTVLSSSKPKQYLKCPDKPYCGTVAGGHPAETPY